MATTAFCTLGKQALLRGDLRIADTYKIALYTGASTNDATLAAYTATQEITGTNYTGGGLALSGATVGNGGTTAWLTFSNPSWTSATFTAASCVIYDSTDSIGPNRALCVLDFGGNQSVSNGTFTIQFPAAAAATALIRLT